MLEYAVQNVTISSYDKIKYNIYEMLAILYFFSPKFSSNLKVTWQNKIHLLFRGYVK